MDVEKTSTESKDPGSGRTPQVRRHPLYLRAPLAARLSTLYGLSYGWRRIFCNEPRCIVCSHTLSVEPEWSTNYA